MKNMRNLLLILVFVLVLTASAFAQSNIKLKHKYGAENGELQSVLYFEDIQLERLMFTGSDLKNKDYQIFIKKFVNGNAAQTEMIFDSKELASFKIADEQLALRVYAKVTSDNTVKFSIESNVYGYRANREYKIAPEQKAFALKNFLGAKPEQAISLKDNNHLLAFMMPYAKKDGSTTYCEVVQSDVTPEELGEKFPIPLYFLIDIKFQ